MKPLKWLVAGVALIVLLVAVAAFALQRWTGGDDFRARASARASEALGVPVQLGRIEVDLFPVPALAVDQVQIRSQPAVVLERVEARPMWAPLLQQRLEIATLVVRKAVVPQRAVAAIAAAGAQKSSRRVEKDKPGDMAAVLALMPRRTVLDQVTWIDAQGNATTVDAQVWLADAGVVESARVEILKGRLSGAKASVQRQADHWSVQADMGGGKITGKARIVPAKGGGAGALQGEFDASGVEVSALTAPSRALTGRLEAHTTVRAELRDPAAVAESAQSQTRFTVRNAVVHGIDLLQAVKTVGLQRGGETRLDTLTGTVMTQGRTIEVNNLVASSGALSAKGAVTMAPNHSLSGRVNVEVAGLTGAGAVGVPLTIGGTVENPSVALTKSALVGAALGTVIAPGAGTGAGAALGDKVGSKLRDLFGK